MGHHIVQLASDAVAFLQERPLGPLRLADGLLLDQFALRVTPLPQRRREQQESSGQGEGEELGTVAVLLGEDFEEEPRAPGGQPDGEQGPPARAQTQADHEQLVADDVHRCPRPGPSVETRGPQHGDGRDDVGGEDHPPCLDGARHGQEERCGLRGGEGTGQGSVHSVVLDQHRRRDRQQSRHGREGQPVRKVAHPGVPRAREQRPGGVRRCAQRQPQGAQFLPGGAHGRGGGRAPGPFPYTVERLAEGAGRGGVVFVVTRRFGLHGSHSLGSSALDRVILRSCIEGHTGVCRHVSERGAFWATCQR